MVNLYIFYILYRTYFNSNIFSFMNMFWMLVLTEFNLGGGNCHWPICKTREGGRERERRASNRIMEAEFCSARVYFSSYLRRECPAFPLSMLFFGNITLPEKFLLGRNCDILKTFTLHGTSNIYYWDFSVSTRASARLRVLMRNTTLTFRVIETSSY